MRVAALAVIWMLPVAADPQLRGPEALELINTCSTSSMPAPKWDSTDRQTRDCNQRLAAAVGALTTAGDVDEDQGVMGFCMKCGKAYDERASKWRTSCSSAPDTWKAGPTQRIRAISQGLDAFGCTKTAEGAYCAEYYAGAVKANWAVPESCRLFESCCYGTLNQWQTVNATVAKNVEKGCKGAKESATKAC